jgi:hypothetical protein
VRINVAAPESERRPGRAKVNDTSPHREGFLVRLVRYQVSAANTSVLIGRNVNTSQGASTMTPKILKQLAAIAIVCTATTAVTSAVGNGLPFSVNEDVVPGAIPRTHNSNSLDFTYHSCVDFVQPPGEPLHFVESGYFWVSSYQNPTSVVDSQINYFDVNGYRIYAKYRYQAQFFNAHQPSPSGLRLNYVAPQQPAIIELYLDWQSNTVLDLQQCAPGAVSGANEDILLGSSAALALGEKSETSNVAANGDFELRFADWNFTNVGEAIFQFPQPAAFYRLVVNANITRLFGGTLNTDHRAEGSGNLFWWAQPQD